MAKTTAICIATIASLGLLYSVAPADEPYFDGLPRTAWAPKLPGGTIKLLYFGPYISMHDSYELMQRFDIEGTCVATSHYKDAHKFGINIRCGLDWNGDGILNNEPGDFYDVCHLELVWE